MEAVGVVTDLVVVKVSYTNAAREILVDRGVDERERSEDKRCERMVVFPEPDSPLHDLRISYHPVHGRYETMKGSQKYRRLVFRARP